MRRSAINLPRRFVELLALLGMVALFWGVTRGGPPRSGEGNGAASADDPRFAAGRAEMVAQQVEARGIRDAAVLKAMRAVPRHRFVPAALQELAYEDQPLPIEKGQTISQPYIVGLMTSLIQPRPAMKVLEIGTGSGYQAAVLAECVGEVDTIETIPALGHKAEALLRDLGYKNVHVKIGDGFDGWPERGPFDAIIVTAAPERVPPPLLAELKLGGRLVAPVGRGEQDLVVMTRTATGFQTESVAGVLFVPMTGKAQADRDKKR